MKNFHLSGLWFICVAVFSISGCDKFSSDNSGKLTQVEQSVSELQSDLTRFKNQNRSLEQKFANIEKDVIRLSDSAELKHEFLRVKKTSKIRQEPTVNKGDNALAIAYKDSYLKLLGCMSEDGESERECEWYHVKFSISGAYLEGYIHGSLVQLEKLTLEQYIAASKLGTINYLWEEQIISIVKRNNINAIGVAIEDGNYPVGFSNFRDRTLIPFVSNPSFTTKIIQSSLENRKELSENIGRYATTNKIEALLQIYNDGSSIRAYLYKYDKSILYVGFIPLNYFEENLKVELINNGNKPEKFEAPIIDGKSS